MPLPTAWFALPHVGTSGRERSSPAVFAHPQVGRLLRSGQRTDRQTGHRLRAKIQCRFLQARSEKTAQASPAQQTHGRDSGQRQVSPCPRTPHLSASASQGAHAIVPATLQSRDQSNRAGLEAHTPISHPQPTFPDTGQRRRYRTRALRTLGKSESTVGETMRHNLGRYV